MSWEHILSRISRNNINTSQKNRQIEKIRWFVRQKKQIQFSYQIDTKKDIQLNVISQLNREKDRQLDRLKDRQLDRQKERQLDRQKDLQLDRQKERQLNI